MPGVLPLATALAVAGLVAAEATGAPRARAALKSAAAVGFVATGAAEGLAFGALPQRAVFAGLVFGAIGDLCLIGRSKPAFLAGLGAFLLNHVAYVAAFLSLGVSPAGAAIAALPLGAVAAAVWAWLGPRAGSLSLPVAAYIAVICAMVACAVGAWWSGGEARGVLLAGAALFFASDLAVARERFVASTPWNKAWGLPTYFAAQLLFATSAPPA